MRGGGVGGGGGIRREGYKEGERGREKEIKHLHRLYWGAGPFVSP